jgi:hypothetical protein
MRIKGDPGEGKQDQRQEHDARHLQQLEERTTKGLP